METKITMEKANQSPTVGHWPRHEGANRDRVAPGGERETAFIGDRPPLAEKPGLLMTPY